MEVVFFLWGGGHCLPLPMNTCTGMKFFSVVLGLWVSTVCNIVYAEQHEPTGELLAIAATKLGQT